MVGSGALVGGTSRNAIAIIVRLNSNGLIDPEFADRGVAFLDTNQETKYTYAMETLTQLLVKMVLSFNNKAAVVLPDHREIAPITF